MSGRNGVGRARRGGGALVAVAGVALAGWVVVPAAGADEIADKKARAEALALKIQQLDHQIESFAEAANGAQYELDRVSMQLAETEGRVAAAQAELDQRRAELKGYAIEAYIRGAGDNSAAIDRLVSSAIDTDLARGYLAAAADDRQQSIDQVRAAQQDLDASVAQLNKNKAAAAAKADEISQQKASAQAALDEQNRLYQQAQGELAELVKAAEARQAAEQAAAAQQRAQQASRSQPRAPRGQPTPPPVVEEPDPLPPSGGYIDAVLAEARRQLGKPYVWGAAGPDAFDCSGFTLWAWRAGGVSLPHYTVAQYNATTHVPMSQIQPGDLIFYGTDLGHNAIYLGDNQIIHAPNSRSVVRIDSLYYWNVPMVASRPSP